VQRNSAEKTADSRYGWRNEFAMGATMRGLIFGIKMLPLFTSVILPVLLAGAAPGPYGSLGKTLDEAKKTDFFQFFNLAQTGETASKDGKKILFQPSGPKFHDLARVYMQLDKNNQISGAELELKRSFVDSGQDGIYARDIAKSFLTVAASPQDRDQLQKLISEIDQPTGTDRPVIAHPDSLKTPVGPPSEGYLVYLGKRDSFQLTLKHGQVLSLLNVNLDNKTGSDKFLRMSFNSGS
jgi:hypothetical protein